MRVKRSSYSYSKNVFSYKLVKKLQFVIFNFQKYSGVKPWKGIGIYELPTNSTSAAQYLSNRIGATQQGYKIFGYYTLP